MSKIKTVLVTGASGFIAKHIILQLLNQGYDVVGSLRSPKRGDEVIKAVTPHLNEATDLEKRLRFVTLDLSSDDGWADAMTGVDALLHTASPFPLNQPKNADDIIRPAVDGTLRALKSAHQAGITRVVLTSSVAAIAYGHQKNASREFDHTDWTPLDQGYISPYTRSKTMAEMAAWDFVKNAAPEMELTTVNPALVVGAPLDEHYGASQSLIERLLKASDPMLPKMAMGLVDVLDIAAMHVRALDHPASIGERLPGSAEVLRFKGMAEIVKQAYPDRKTVTREAPSFVIRLASMIDKSLQQVVPELGRDFQLSSRNSVEKLEMKLRPAKKALLDSAEAIIGHGRA